MNYYIPYYINLDLYDMCYASVYDTFSSMPQFGTITDFDSEKNTCIFTPITLKNIDFEVFGSYIQYFTFDKNNDLYFQMSDKPIVYKYIYDLENNEFIPFDGLNGILIDYTHLLKIQGLEPKSFVIDEEGYIYICIPYYPSYQITYGNYSIIQYDKDGYIINDNYNDLVIKGDHDVTSGMFMNYNSSNQTFYFSIPDLNQIYSLKKTVYTNTFQFTDVYLYSGLNNFFLYDQTMNTNIAPLLIDVAASCFKEGTKILCRISDKEDAYIPIERLTDNNYIKTWKHGYKRVKYVLQSTILNSSMGTFHKLYKLSKSKNPLLI